MMGGWDGVRSLTWIGLGQPADCAMLGARLKCSDVSSTVAQRSWVFCTSAPSGLPSVAVVAILGIRGVVTR